MISVSSLHGSMFSVSEILETPAAFPHSWSGGSIITQLVIPLKEKCKSQKRRAEGVPCPGGVLSRRKYVSSWGLIRLANGRRKLYALIRYLVNVLWWRWCSRDSLADLVTLSSLFSSVRICLAIISLFSCEAFSPPIFWRCSKTLA